MGFDDIVSDAHLYDQIKEMIQPLIGQYNYEKWDNLEAMENGVSETYAHYNAYSLAYKLIYQTKFCLAQGAHPVNLKDVKGWDAIKWLKVRTRKEVLEMYLEKKDKLDDETQVKIEIHFQECLQSAHDIRASPTYIASVMGD
jgi:hypothetical protein